MDKDKKREYEKSWYQGIGKQKRKEANKRWQIKKIEEFKILKEALKCNRCDESHIVCLDFHHIDPNQKEGNVGQIARNYSTKRLLEEINKCEILCSNCHRKEHYKE